MCFNFLAKKVEIIYSASHNNVDNGAILVCVNLLVIFYITFSSFWYSNSLIFEVTYYKCTLLFFPGFGASQSIFLIKSPNQPGVKLFLWRACNWSNWNYLGWKFQEKLILTQGCMQCDTWKCALEMLRNGRPCLRSSMSIHFFFPCYN